MGQKNKSYPQIKHNNRFDDQDDFNDKYYYKKQKEQQKKKREKDKASKYQFRYEPL
jgi:rRNA processing protein Gar1